MQSSPDERDQGSPTRSPGSRPPSCQHQRLTPEATPSPDHGFFNSTDFGASVLPAIIESRFALNSVPGFHVRNRVRLRHAIADLEQHPHVLHGAAEVPVGLHLVGHGVVVLLRVLVALLLAVVGRLADVVDARPRGRAPARPAWRTRSGRSGSRSPSPARRRGAPCGCPPSARRAASSSVELPSPITVKSLVLPHRLITSMLMLARVLSSG